MSFDVPSIVVMIFASIVGLAFIKYGKREADVPYIVAGIALLCYGYFVEQWLASLAVGIAIALAPWAYRRFL
jgi:hypothetical protein